MKNFHTPEVFMIEMKLKFLLVFLFFAICCQSQNSKQMEHNYTNNLIYSTSPYLLQHAHNPVNWEPWSEETVQRAKQDNILILVSIGYAACHWCHVMEHECFEDEEVARVMNENFICIKVDREERPDVDHYFMTAVQLMQMQGGWPLNVIALPDGRPIWGGTYFPKETWIKNLVAVAEFYRKNREKTEEYAISLQQGIEQTLLIVPGGAEINPDSKLLETAIDNWKERFDLENGGRLGAPKFPMPVNLDFLLNYGFLKNDKTVLGFVETTLTKMARGGIYDQVGGGFARYSVDESWKVPHFEKMLYDNGQLLSTYSKGFQLFKKEEFKQVVYETTDFLERELMDSSGAFYSSLDADSDGEEGKFYVWNQQELKELLGQDYQLFASFYHVGGKGYWEQGNNILLREGTNEDFAAANGLSPEILENKISVWKNMLLNERSERIRPGLDDKTLTSWNAIVIQGLTDAYKASHDERFLNLALKNAQFILDNILQKDGSLFHTWKNGKTSVDGFLEDYALTIQAFISLFEISGHETWLSTAVNLTKYTIDHFYDEQSGLFFFSEKEQNSIVTNHFQKEDNVIPASNSIMANNLHKLFLILGNSNYKTLSDQMLNVVFTQFPKYPMAYANWGNLILKNTESFYEVVVCGENSGNVLEKMQIGFQPHILWAFTEKESLLPVFKDRFVAGDTLIYICQEGICQLPVNSAEEALKLLQKN